MAYILPSFLPSVLPAFLHADAACAPVPCDERARTDAQALQPCYRSEAFAEDLSGDTVAGVPRLPPFAAPVLTAVPLLAALGGVLATLLG